MTRAPDSVVVRAADESGVGDARRAARRTAELLGFDDVAAEKAAIVATEMTRNLVRHGGGGELLLTAVEGDHALDVLALDRGRGIPDVERALRDGYSTAGTAGQGLGAIGRAASSFDVYSIPGKGTAVWARLGGDRPRGPLETGAVCVALASERECGDAWALEAAAGRPALLVADGLGHGSLAAAAAHAAVAAFRKHSALPAGRLLETIHQALRPTRGAAVAVAELLTGTDTVRYAGIGNVAGVLAGAHGARKMISLAGTAGHQVRSIRAFEYELPAGGLLVLHSDGIGTHWDLPQYPGLASRHPALVAGVLYRDFARPRDDATVVVARRRTS